MWRNVATLICINDVTAYTDLFVDTDLIFRFFLLKLTQSGISYLELSGKGPDTYTARKISESVLSCASFVYLALSKGVGAVRFSSQV